MVSIRTKGAALVERIERGVGEQYRYLSLDETWSLKSQTAQKRKDPPPQKRHLSLTQVSVPFQTHFSSRETEIQSKEATYLRSRRPGTSGSSQETRDPG